MVNNFKYRDKESSKKIQIYRPNQRHELSYIQTWIIIARNILASRELTWQLFKRDYFATYKKSFIGVSWVLLSPIIGILSWVFLKSAGMLNPGEIGIPYLAYILVGSSMWGLFVGIFTASTQTLTSVQGIVMQVNFSRETLLFNQAAIQVVNFIISMIINVVVIIIFGIKPSIYSLFLPFVIIPIFFLASSIGLIVSMIAIVAVDINKLITAFIQLLLYTTPIIYSNNIENPWIKTMIKWNPLTYLICSARDLIFWGRLYDTTGFIICSLISFLLFLMSLRLFFVSENKIIERMI